jgi:ABC-2 type transport system permease protein
MSRSVAWRFFTKDLRFSTPFIVGSTVTGVAALFLAKFGTAGFNVAMTLLITALVVQGTLLPLFLNVSERKDRSLLFALSLPISTARYAVTKVGAILVAYLIPWILLPLIGAVGHVISPFPAGIVPFASAMWVFLLLHFCLILSATLLSELEAGWIAAVVICNVSISFFIFFLQSNASIDSTMRGAVAAWVPAIRVTLAAEIAAIGLVGAFTYYRLSHRKDFI